MSRKFTRGRRLVVRMGDYESMEIYAGVEYDPDEMVKGYDPNDDLDYLIAQDVEDARMSTDREDSFIHHYYEDLDKRGTNA